MIKTRILDGQLSFIIQMDEALQMQYRSRSDISAQILEVAQQYCTPTKIMYGAYLSYSQLREYLSILIGNGLISEDRSGSSKVYKTTQKGKQYLNAYSQMDALVGTMARRN